MLLYIPDVVVGIFVGMFMYHALVKRMINSPRYQGYKSFYHKLFGGKDKSE